MRFEENKQYLDWNNQGDKTIQLRYDMFLQRRAAVEQQLRDIQRTLVVVDFKIKYYARALRAGTMSIYDGKKIKMPDFFADAPENSK